MGKSVNQNCKPAVARICELHHLETDRYQFCKLHFVKWCLKLNLRWMSQSLMINDAINPIVLVNFLSDLRNLHVQLIFDIFVKTVRSDASLRWQSTSLRFIIAHTTITMALDLQNYVKWRVPTYHRNFTRNNVACDYKYPQFHVSYVILSAINKVWHWLLHITPLLNPSVLISFSPSQRTSGLISIHWAWIRAN